MVSVSIIVVLWLFPWVPSLINVLINGRVYVPFGQDAVARAPLADSANTFLLYSLFVLVSLALMLGTLLRVPARFGAVMLLSVPWAAIHLVDWGAGGTLSLLALLFPLCLVALSVCAPVASDFYRLAAVLTVLTALLSILLAVAPGAPGLMPQAAFEGGEKALLGGTILAGPYGHSNQLGINLALGLPFVALVLKGKRRAFGLIAVVTALVWSASRTSLSVTIAVLLITGIVLLGNRQWTRTVVYAAIFAGVTVMVALPLNTTHPDAFSSRGLIWTESLRAFAGSPWVGVGADAYSTWSQLSLNIGAVINSGHNVFVTVLTLGGLLGVLALVIVFAVLAVRSARAYPVDPVPGVFLLVLVLISIIEEPLRGFIIAPTSYIAWPMLIHVANARPFASRGQEVKRSMAHRQFSAV